MHYALKNLSGFPLDIPTLAGPAILPAGGEIVADLGALDAEVMRQSPYVEMAEAEAAHATDDGDELAKLRADYQEVVGKKAYHGWSAEELQEKIDAKLAE